MDGILIVDDDREKLGLLRHVLEGEGVNAQYVTSGEEAVQKLMAEPCIELMVTDFHMPGMDGIELTMLAKEITPNITVVMMTGDISPDLPGMAAGAGVSKMLAKPFSPQQLLDIIRGRKHFFM